MSVRDMFSLGAWRMGPGWSGEILPPSSSSPSAFGNLEKRGERREKREERREKREERREKREDRREKREERREKREERRKERERERE